MPLNSFSAIKGECTQGYVLPIFSEGKQRKILGIRNLESRETGKSGLLTILSNSFSENEGECGKYFLPWILDSERFRQDRLFEN